jgi:hypothetical protein
MARTATPVMIETNRVMCAHFRTLRLFPPSGPDLGSGRDACYNKVAGTAAATHPGHPYRCFRGVVRPQRRPMRKGQDARRSDNRGVAVVFRSRPLSFASGDPT